MPGAFGVANGAEPALAASMSSNRFDALRLAFAAIVAAYHLVVLPRLDPAGELEASLATLAELSIQGFFILSGLLVYGSWNRSPTLADYVGKRVRRLYPAYAVVILVPALIAFGLGGAIPDVLRYLSANLVFLNFLEPALPGLFAGHRFEAVNGALWTLKIEVMFYALLLVLGPCLGWLGRRGMIWIASALMLIYLGGEAWRMLFLWQADVTGDPILSTLSHQLPGQMGFFASGMALWIWQDLVKKRLGAVGRAGLVALAASFVVPGLEPLRPAALAALVAWAGWARGPSLPAARFGDISYGLYICHFPIIQAVIAAGLFDRNAAIGVLVSLVATLIASVALWHFVERPALRADSHYRRPAS